MNPAECAESVDQNRAGGSCAADVGASPSNNALQPIVGAVAVGMNSRRQALAPPSAERERSADTDRCPRR